MSKRLSSLLVALMLVGAVVTPAAGLTITTDRYVLRAFIWNDNRVRVATFVGGQGVVVKKAMAYRRFSGRRKTSSMGATSGAFVATNGDFRMLDTQAPKHLSVVDGEIMSTGNPHLPGWVLRTNADGTQAWITRPVFEVRASQGTVSFPIVGWNAQQPRFDKVVAFTARGGAARHPIASTCSALLAPVSGIMGPNRVYRVVEVRKNATCSLDPLQPPKRRMQHVVLAGDPVRALHEATNIAVSVDLGKGGVVRQVIGGYPQLVKRGTNVGPRCNGPCFKSGTGPDAALYAKNPRTVIGISKGCPDWDMTTPCRYFMVTVDGRQAGSEGLRFPPMAKLMLQLGAYEAMNLDGGGSTTMWVRQRNVACRSRTAVGCLVNRPSYGEREILDAVVMVPTS